ncbi:hypothetical protein BL250_14815 [Erwinia sp. OLTSP20]|uniref:YdcF family protein n=1 Tax=unclassified Erwinia TaxID=2622719 RepID=UPI000C4AE316|nr:MULTISPECIES: YdcF family protein [unclassified Erwinia]PIJ48362.1 hypothetical protein BV501_17380 [Erwinia sp. OAMSP11]PIJ68477.1 hypothetical protein BK416_16410 [Erwinia sp. OLSSP12]PIJ78854.1 hypothetical protein BLD47_16330 [Erwinia sp. OLCASP19]PIJ79771.1 hypothetical protein BLD46_16625 [Erwinia sp. OLMTSP26]PIJ81273.1 hypothetical protein BLD49_16585 [Erwinia sp. OLMDSP33]
MDWTTLSLNNAEADAVNTLCRWLGENDDSDHHDIDVIVLAGNSAIPTLEAAFRLALSSGRPLWLTGGIGHATAFLVEAVRQHPHYGRLQVEGQSEGDIMAAMAASRGVPAGQIFIESRSRNTGENAAFTRRLMTERQFFPRQIVLMQDPLLQRRTSATFRHLWRDCATAPQIISWPGWTVQIEATLSGWRPAGYAAPWDAERFFALMMGEIPRLRNDENGYGPRGQGFIGKVDVPSVVEQAWQLLRQRGFGLSRL